MASSLKGWQHSKGHGFSRAITTTKQPGFSPCGKFDGLMINSAETQITGKWIAIDGHVQSDEAEQRIRELISTYLHYLAVDSSGWEKLYRDPADGRYWELTFPHGALQAGARRNYDVSTRTMPSQNTP
jgi:hypothetical protein